MKEGRKGEAPSHIGMDVVASIGRGSLTTERYLLEGGEKKEGGVIHKFIHTYVYIYTYIYIHI